MQKQLAQGEGAVGGGKGSWDCLISATTQAEKPTRPRVRPMHIWSILLLISYRNIKVRLSIFNANGNEFIKEEVPERLGGGKDTSYTTFLFI